VGPPVEVSIDGRPVAPGEISCEDLHRWPERPPERALLVDPTCGRLVLGAGYGEVEAVDVSYCYGFPGDLGGGPYDQRSWRIARPLPAGALELSVREGGAVVPAAGTDQSRFGSVRDALAAWTGAGRPNAVITILDSRTHDLPGRIRLDHSSWLALEAADGERPLLVTKRDGCRLEVTDLPRHTGTEAMLTLSGVVVEGHLVVAGPVRRLRLLHSTLVPGRRCEEGRSRAAGPSLVVRGGPHSAVVNGRLRVEVAFSVTGALHVPEDAEGLWVLDSIVDGLGQVAIRGSESPDGDSAPAWLERSTVLGRMRVKQLSASDVIFTGRVTVDHVEAGCVRFCHVPPGSRTPDRYASQPDLALGGGVHEAARMVRPRFTSREYGHPGYCQLALDCPDQVRTGSEDGSEMGAFCFLEQPQRVSNLRMRLQEHLPLGLDARLVFVT
jgi:hypothetical protein